MKSIVFYTHRVSFILNWVSPLSEFLDCKIYVFHINSLDKERLVINNKLEGVDIVKYSSKEIIEKLKQIKPNVVIFLGFRSLIELLLLRICKSLKIETIYLEHGLFTKDTTRLNTVGATRNVQYTFIKYLNFITKYIGFLWITSSKIFELKILFHAFFLKQYQTTKFDKALFFSEHGFKRIDSLFNYDNDQVIYCGYPLFKSKSEIENTNHKSAFDEFKTVIYIHQPFILYKQTSINYNNEVEYVTSIWNILKGKYNHFTLLLHPSESLSLYNEFYRNSGIEVIQKPNDYRVFLDKDLIIGHYSTALLYSLYFKKKTVIINYPNLEIDTLFSDYCKYCSNMDEFKSYCISTNKNEIKVKSLQYLIGEENNYEYISNTIYNLL